ncbi:MAG: carbonic anhydrase [Clostridia bacterium]|nr:carbonic anhydrase [Clostridia bacterium]
METHNQNVAFNPETSYNSDKDFPSIDPTAYIHPQASVIGEVKIGQEVFVAPFASIRGDEGLRIYIGEHCNVQDGAVLHGLKNFHLGENNFDNSIFIGGEPFSIYVSKRVTMAHQCQIHGPAHIDSDVFVGMQALVFNSIVNEGAVLEPGCKVMGVVIPKNSYVRTGQIITSQEDADALPQITQEYKYKDFNQKVVDVNIELARGYMCNQYKQ